MLAINRVYIDALRKWGEKQKQLLRRAWSKRTNERRGSRNVLCVENVCFVRPRVKTASIGIRISPAVMQLITGSLYFILSNTPRKTEREREKESFCFFPSTFKFIKMRIIREKEMKRGCNRLQPPSGRRNWNEKKKMMMIIISERESKVAAFVFGWKEKKEKKEGEFCLNGNVAGVM